jgi:CysZ protein
MAAQTVFRQFAAGPRLLGRGLLICLRNPRLLLLGIAPALVTGVLFLAGSVTLFVFLDNLSVVVTWFADDWADVPRTAIRVLAGFAIVGLAALLGVLTFTAVTLAIGAPFYERISANVEEHLGGAPDGPELALIPSIVRGLGDAVRILGISLVFGIGLFAIGLIPVAGQFLAPVLGAAVAGWFLALELSAVPFERRALRLADRRSALRRQRPTALGFGIAVFLCFLVPLGAILLMPAAVAGGTLLARRSLDAVPA